MRMINRFIDWILILTGTAFAVAAWVLMPIPAHAEDSPRLENIESMEPREFCTVVADEFLAGAVNQAAGHAREIRLASAEILENVEHGVMPSKEAMYVPEWDKLTEAEQDFVRVHTFTGYDEAAKIGRPVTDEEAWAMAQAYFRKCVTER